MLYVTIDMVMYGLWVDIHSIEIWAPTLIEATDMYTNGPSLCSVLGGGGWGRKERDGTGNSDTRDLDILIIILFFSSFIVILNLKHFKWVNTSAF